MTLTRRDVLKAAAMSVGAIGCRGRGSPLAGPIRGAIVGGAHARGHRVRGAAPPLVTPGERTGVVILGAGMAGLSAAWTLERAGYRDFVLLELEDAPGGTSQSGRSVLTPYPWGAHYVPVPSPANRPLVALLGEVGAITGQDGLSQPVYAEDVLCRDPQERVFYRGQWYEGLYPRAGATPADLAELEAFEAAMRGYAARRDAGGRRAFALPRSTGAVADESRSLDASSMAQLLEARGWRSERLRWLVDHACRDDFGTTLEETSAWAGVHYFASRVEGVTGEPAAFLTWPEGNGRLVHHLAAVAGPRLRTGCTVLRVGTGASGVTVTWHDERADAPRALQAEHAVFALPRFLVGPLVFPGAPPAHLTATTYGSWMVANLTLRGHPTGRGFPLAWDNVLYDSPSLGYVVATHQRGRDVGPTVLTYYLPLPGDPRAERRGLLETAWETWVDFIVKDLTRAHPGLRELVETIDVWLWGHAMVRPVPGYLFSDALTLSSRPVGRIHFAHTDLSGMALVEEAQDWGVRAAEAILREQGHRFTSWRD